MAKPGSRTRVQRDVVLELLKDVKGVSISEMGKLPNRAAGMGSASGGGSGHAKPARSKMAQEFMTPSNRPGAAGGIGGGSKAGGANDEALDGLSNLFEG
jgi:exportin-5